MSVKKDVIANFKHNCIYDKLKVLLEDLSDFDYDRDWVDSPAACGDTHKYTVSYSIGEFDFEYWHVSGDGEIASAKFSITHKEDEETLFEYSMLGEMMARMSKSKKPKTYPLNKKLFDKFKTNYPLEIEDPIELRAHYYFFLGVLSAFTMGHSITIKIDQKGKTGLFHESLGGMIDVVSSSSES